MISYRIPQLASLTLIAIVLSACGTTKTVVEYREVKIPQHLTVTEPPPKLQGDTNGALESWLVDLLEYSHGLRIRLQTIGEHYGE